MEVPQSWKDLMDPKYEGLIVMANPGATGTGVTPCARRPTAGAIRK